MQKSAEPSLRPAAPALERPTLRVIPLEAPAGARREDLVRRLAADRLRDLRDDGVTTAYVARMYGVEAALLEEVAADLLPRRR